MHFVINRSKWARGERKGRDGYRKCNHLLCLDGFQCCMGQVCTAIGVPDEALLRAGTISFARERLMTKPRLVGQIDAMFLRDRESSTLVEKTEMPWVAECYRLNDDSKLDDQSRERALTESFASAGHTIEFKD